MSDARRDKSTLVPTLGIVGVGLLGGSVALAAKSRGLVQRVIGVGRNASRLEAAQDAGVIDVGATELEALAGADLVVVCTPVDRIAGDVIAVAACTGAECAVTDVGSIKGAIVRDVIPAAAARKFVPAHPLAGSEQAGWEAGSATLFEGRVCVLTPGSHPDPQRVQRVEQFWRGLGMRIVRLAPDEHDRMLALTSHLPHVVAAALATLVGDEERPFAATGFRDTTRIAAGDAAVWTPILLGNGASLVESLDRLTDELARLRDAVTRGDADAITQWLATARECRNALN
jgi:prephenate dehydrogenase